MALVSTYCINFAENKFNVRLVENCTKKGYIRYYGLSKKISDLDEIRRLMLFDNTYLVISHKDLNGFKGSINEILKGRVEVIYI